MPPTISIIVATKDRSRLLAGCLDSICQQTLLNTTEVIVIDKSRTDKDKQVVESYQKRLSSLRYIRQRNSGLYAAWNTAIAQAKGKYLINLNTDDRLKHNALELLSKALDKNPHCALVYGDSYITTKANETLEKNSSRGQMLDLPNYSQKELLLRCICGPHPMWRKKLHKKFGLFDTSYRIAADYEFWLRISQHHQLLHINKPVGLYYKNPRGLASSKKMIELKNRENIQIKKKYLNSSTL